MQHHKKLSRKRVGLGLASGAVALALMGGVASVANAAAASPVASPSSSDARPGHHRDGFEGSLAKKLATKLSVSESKVRDALKAFRESNKPADSKDRKASSMTPAQRKSDHQAREKALATSLAKSLGVEEAKVSSALKAIQDEAKASRAAELKTRLDDAVRNGKLSSTEESAILKAAGLGLLTRR